MFLATCKLYMRHKSCDQVKTWNTYLRISSGPRQRAWNILKETAVYRNGDKITRPREKNLQAAVTEFHLQKSHCETQESIHKTWWNGFPEDIPVDSGYILTNG
ncbi:uncharacterized protein GJ701_017900 isoform 1-T1 [Geothlypis trichas]